MKYQIVLSDPPWQQTKGNLRKCRPNQGKSLDYETLSLSEIKQIHKDVSESLCDIKHNFFVWTIDKYLHDTESIMKDIGYELHARFIWNKLNGIAPAFTVRYSHEYLLWFYKKGNILMPDITQRGKFTTVFSEQATIHSKKPEYAYSMIESMFPDTQKLELFARSKRAGWTCLGNEIDGTDLRNVKEIGNA